LFAAQWITMKLRPLTNKALILMLIVLLAACGNSGSDNVRTNEGSGDHTGSNTVDQTGGGVGSRANGSTEGVCFGSPLLTLSKPTKGLIYEYRYYRAVTLPRMQYTTAIKN